MTDLESLKIVVEHMIDIQLGLRQNLGTKHVSDQLIGNKLHYKSTKPKLNWNCDPYFQRVRLRNYTLDCSNKIVFLGCQKKKHITSLKLDPEENSDDDNSLFTSNLGIIHKSICVFYSYIYNNRCVQI